MNERITRNHILFIAQKFNLQYEYVILIRWYRKELRAFTFLLVLGQYLKMANSDKSNNTTIGKNILIIAKEKSLPFI